MLLKAPLNSRQKVKRCDSDCSAAQRQTSWTHVAGHRVKFAAEIKGPKTVIRPSKWTTRSLQWHTVATISLKHTWHLFWNTKTVCLYLALLQPGCLLV